MAHVPHSWGPDQGAQQRNVLSLSKRLGLWAISTALMGSAGSTWSYAQNLPPDFLAPSLVLNAQGHTDQVRDMIFTSDGKSLHLLSGGKDKIVHVWEVNERTRNLRLDRSLRPPIRRRGGRVYALALSSLADAQGRRKLAVAGIGTIGSGGGILIYQFPGRTDKTTGDLLFELTSESEGTPVGQRRGHTGAVFGLSFSPNGRYLASCSQDQTIRVWDMEDATPKTVAVLQGHNGFVTRVAFIDDARIVSGGGVKDGTIRLWDWRAQRLTTSVAPSAEDLAAFDGAGVLVSALAVTSDGKYIVVGRENGMLERYDGAGLQNGLILNPDSMKQRRPVEVLAISPNGKLLASSVLKNESKNDEYPIKTCDVALRALSDGRPVGPRREIDGLVRALAFSPDGQTLAVAGGEAQQIALLDVQPQGIAEGRTPTANGPGTTLWDAAFVDAKPTVAYSRTRSVAGNAVAWEGFDLAERQFVSVAPGAALSRAVQTIPGWKFVSRALDQVAVVPDQGAEIPVQLNPVDGRWSSFTFIPANAQAGHPKPCIAIGCEEGGVLVVSLPDGLRTRLLLGHSGAVQAMAPSPDGRWLLTASADMTLSLWSLAGCDARPALGAEIAPDAQGQGGVVQKILTRSFAEHMGLKVGDHVVSVIQRPSGELLPIKGLDSKLASIAPSLDGSTRFQVARQGVAAAIPMSTLRADDPALKLFPGGDREWVVWMPEGYYETSIAGDHRLLGWHLNHIDTRDPNRFASLPSDFFPMSRYEKQLRKPAILDEVLRTADAVKALALVNGTPVVQKPPVIRVVAPRPVALGAEIVTTEPNLPLDIEVTASPNRQVRSMVVHGDTIRYPAHVVEPAAASAKASEVIRLRPNKNVVLIEATDDLGVTAIEKLEVRLDPRLIPPPMNPALPKLVIRAFGIETFQDRGVRDIPHAQRDAEELAGFFQQPDGRAHFDKDRIDLHCYKNVDAQQILEVFEALAEDVRAKKLKAGDTVFIIIESHLFSLDSAAGTLILSADSNLKSDDQHAVPGAGISERLDELTKNGCLVMVLIDGIHGGTPGASSRRAIGEWIRNLAYERGVLVMTASKQDPSERLNELGAFAKAVLESQKIAGGRRAVATGLESSPTLFEFESSVLDQVLQQTSRRQRAGFYAPETLEWHRIRIFDPQVAPVNDLVKR